MGVNHELNLEQEATAKKSNSITKPDIPIPGMVRSLRPQGAGNNLNKKKRKEKCRAYKCQNRGGEHIGQCPKPAKYFNYGKNGHIKKDFMIPNKTRNRSKVTPETTILKMTKSMGKIYIAHVEEDNNEE